ncbi:hypothetical protein ABL57_06135 [Kocuria sp. SM24M-10]|nr:hypothetical protein ABL57_06135 [Kocuria sp. SM24M-10]
MHLAIAVTASPAAGRAVPSAALVAVENDTFRISRQRPANSIAVGVAPCHWSAVDRWTPPQLAPPVPRQAEVP